MLEAKVSWFDTDKPGHEQNSVQDVKSTDALLLLNIFQDVGKSILESYSSVLESLVSNIITRIDDLLNIDELNRHAEHFTATGDAGCKIACSQTVVPSFPVLASGTPFMTAYATPSFSPAQLASPTKKETTSLTLGRRSQHSRGAGVKKALMDHVGNEIRGMIISGGTMIDVSTTTEL